jgi:aldehyde:ferredoxin oxidoreductase
MRLGLSRKDDYLPPRILSNPGGGTVEQLPHFYKMLHEYYSVRNWDELGFPAKECLDKLGLTTHAEDAYAEF